MNVLMRGLMALFMMLSTLCLYASRYVVFKVNGDVKIQSANGWVVPKKRQAIALKDMVRIGPEAVIGVLDKESKGIYYSSAEGDISVSNIIRSAKKQAGRHTSLVAGSLANGGSRSAARRSSRKVVGGVSSVLMRGQEEDAADGMTDSVSMSRDAMWRVLNPMTLNREALSAGAVDKVLFGYEIDADSVMTFRVANDSDEELAVNVVKLGDEAAPQFLISGGEDNCTLVLAPHTDVAVDWVLVLYEPDAEYFLLVTDADFNVMYMRRFVDSIHKSGTPQESRPAMISAEVWNATARLLPPSPIGRCSVAQ